MQNCLNTIQTIVVPELNEIIKTDKSSGKDREKGGQLISLKVPEL